MLYKTTFLDLQPRSQLYLRLYIGAIAVVALIELLFYSARYSIGITMFFGLLELALLFCAIRPASAPEAYFKMIPWFLFFGIASPVWHFFNLIAHRQAFSATSYASGLDLLLALIFASSVFKYLNSVNQARTASGATSSQAQK